MVSNALRRWGKYQVSNETLIVVGTRDLGHGLVDGHGVT